MSNPPLKSDLVPDEWTEEEHRQMDERIRSVTRIQDTSNILAAAVILSLVVTDCGERLDQRFSNIRTCEAILKEEASLMPRIVDGFRNGFKNVRCLKSLRPPKPEPAQKAPRSMDSSQEKAITAGWNAEYIGDVADALWDHIHHFATEPMEVMTTDKKLLHLHIRYSAVVQSSGMGKSRAVDEMSKHHFVIPINFFAQGSSGFPPADRHAYDYLFYANDRTTMFIHVCTFLHALFALTGDVLLNRYDIAWPPHLPAIDAEQPFAPQFRTLMTYGMRPGCHGEFRSNFYKEVCSSASQLISNYETVVGIVRPADGPADMFLDMESFPLNQAFRSLCDILQGHRSALSSTGERPIKILKGDFSDGGKENPLVVLSFDDIQTLIGSRDGGSWSPIGEIRRALQELGNKALFSLFLSTTAEPATCVTTRRSRLVLRRMTGEDKIMPAFTDFGFDLMAQREKFSDGVKLSEVSSQERFCWFGRPMWYAYDRRAEHLIRFAAKKLLGGMEFEYAALNLSQKLACLAHRVPIEFISSASSPRVATEERTQVQAHMRVVLRFADTLETMVTALPSEPVLSEAAYFMMEAFDVADALMTILNEFPVNKDGHGELLVMLLLTMARDSAVGPSDPQGRPQRGHRWCGVTELLESLFNTDDCVSVLGSFGVEVTPTQDAVELNIRLEDMFKDSKVYFNHFVKIQEQKVVHKRYLMRLMARGAAVLCASCRSDVDMIIPFLFRGEELKEDQIGAILVQVKNDEAYTQNPTRELFRSMDPHHLGISPSADIPVIRIAFALAATTPALVKPDPFFRTAQSEYAYRAYDFWVAGLSPTILRPIVGKENTWKALLQASYGWQAMYSARSELRNKLRRSANPGVAREEEHWENWWEEE